MQNLIKSGHIKLNDVLVKSGVKINNSDVITGCFPIPRESHIKPENIALNILYEDDDLVIINKPAGMIVHPGAGNRSGTLVNALLYHCKSLSGINGILRPGIVHRLDKNTSGILVVAKNDISHVNLSRQFEKKEIQRIYHAFVWGVPKPESGEIVTQIGRSRRDRKKMTVLRSQGREAITGYRLIEDYIYLAHLELSLKTGRTHQIRVHLNHIHHPVFGDADYNGRTSQLHRLPSHLQKRGASLLKGIDRQALHAKTLSFLHPRIKKIMEFDSDLPADMSGIKDKIKDTLMI